MGSEILAVLNQCLRHFVHLDESNAAIHMAPVRYSPITFKVADSIEALTPEDEDVSEEMGQVLRHRGNYELDAGR